MEHCTGCPFCGTSTHFFLIADSSTAFIVDPCDNFFTLITWFESSFAVASTFSSWVRGGQLITLLARCFSARNCLFNQLLPIQKYQGCYKVVTRLWQACNFGCNNLVTRLLQPCKNFGFETVSTLSQPCYNLVSTLFQPCLEVVFYHAGTITMQLLHSVLTT